MLALFAFADNPVNVLFILEPIVFKVVAVEFKLLTALLAELLIEFKLVDVEFKPLEAVLPAVPTLFKLLVNPVVLDFTVFKLVPIVLILLVV